MSAATDAIGACHFNGDLYGLQVPSRDCHVGLRPPRNDKSGDWFHFHDNLYRSAALRRERHAAPLQRAIGSPYNQKPPQRSSPLRRQLFRKNQMRATPEALAASATAAATALPTRGSNAFGMI